MRAALLTLAVLVAVSVSTTVLAVGYGGVMIGVPYHDATPAQAAEQQYHMGVCDWLMAGAGLSWLVTIAAAIVTTVLSGVNRKRSRTEGVR